MPTKNTCDSHKIFVMPGNKFVIEECSTITQIGGIDPVQQALNIITMMSRGVSTKVVVELCKMLGADINRVVEIGEQHRIYTPLKRTATTRKINDDQMKLISRFFDLTV